jgi:hypothetical protein
MNPTMNFTKWKNLYIKVGIMYMKIYIVLRTTSFIRKTTRPVGKYLLKKEEKRLSFSAIQLAWERSICKKSCLCA